MVISVCFFYLILRGNYSPVLVLTKNILFFVKGRYIINYRKAHYALLKSPLLLRISASVRLARVSRMRNAWAAGGDCEKNGPKRPVFIILNCTEPSSVAGG